MDSIETVIMTFFLSLFFVLVLCLSSYIRYRNKLQNCQEDFDD